MRSRSSWKCKYVWRNGVPASPERGERWQPCGEGPHGERRLSIDSANGHAARCSVAAVDACMSFQGERCCEDPSGCASSTERVAGSGRSRSPRSRAFRLLNTQGIVYDKEKSKNRVSTSAMRLASRISQHTSPRPAAGRHESPALSRLHGTRDGGPTCLLMSRRHPAIEPNQQRRFSSAARPARRQ